MERRETVPKWAVMWVAGNAVALPSPSTSCLLGNIITSISSQVHLVCVICINCCQYLCFVYNLSIDISVPGTRKESKVWSILNVDNMHFT